MPASREALRTADSYIFSRMRSSSISSLVDLAATIAKCYHICSFLLRLTILRRSVLVKTPSRPEAGAFSLLLHLAASIESCSSSRENDAQKRRVNVPWNLQDKLCLIVHALD